eukprot:TRINITY_DN9525_c0_g1_i1.p1 TRINITY_DN9525_c0_g1~~TRINITY_DN9525_c0_g1_i1.p1  ORF type:complete len:161 (+),score=20.28 TRINITY_DN9525_c0_g1_i1:88-570(+)
MNSYTYRFAKEEDFDFIMSGKRKIWDLDKEYLPPNEVKEQEENTQQGITNQTTLIAEASTERIGFLEFTLSDQTPYGGPAYGLWGRKLMWICYLFVLEAWQRKGVGRFLYQVAEDYCRQNYVKDIILDVYFSNPGSAEFHKKLGFKPLLQIYSKKINFDE